MKIPSWTSWLYKKTSENLMIVYYCFDSIDLWFIYPCIKTKNQRCDNNKYYFYYMFEVREHAIYNTIHWYTRRNQNTIAHTQNTNHLYILYEHSNQILRSKWFKITTINNYK